MEQKIYVFCHLTRNLAFLQNIDFIGALIFLYASTQYYWALFPIFSLWAVHRNAFDNFLWWLSHLGMLWAFALIFSLIDPPQDYHPFSHMISKQRSWRDVSVVESSGCSSRRLEFNSQHLYGRSQPSITFPHISWSSMKHVFNL